MDPIKKIYIILKEFFPDVLSALMIEYITTAHDIKKIATYQSILNGQSFNTICYIYNGIIWLYDYSTDKLECVNIYTKLPYEYNIAGYMCVRTTLQNEIEIFAANHKMIYIYNKNCEKKRSIKINEFHTPMLAVSEVCTEEQDDNIYIYRGASKIFKIYDIAGFFVNEVDTKDVIRRIKVANGQVYILTNKKILQYSSEHGIKKTFTSKKTINDFCIIDDYIYVVYHQNNYVYGYNNMINNVKCIDIIDAEYIFFDNDTIYITQFNDDSYIHSRQSSDALRPSNSLTSIYIPDRVPMFAQLTSKRLNINVYNLTRHSMIHLLKN